MIDRIRQDIQERLDQLLAEADQLRSALTALGGERRSSTRAARSSSPTRSRSRSTAASPATTARRTRSTSSSSRSRAGSTGSRGSAGGTKNSVLKALADSGDAMTASEVASKTGLGRASVSTTLSKLAKSGEVTKAQRGYRLSGPDANANGQPAAATTTES